MPVLPTVSFKEFVKNPIVALLFLCLTAIGTLYYQNVTTLGNQIKDLQSEITQLKKDYKELMVIGGGQIYEMALPLANKVWLTRVHTQIDGDTFFPNLGNEWHKHTIESHHADEKHAFDFDFECWQLK